jgi:hypothetical protein
VKILALILILTSICFADFKFEDWQKDKWASREGTIIIYDKLEHAAGAVILERGFRFVLPEENKKLSPLFAFGAGLMWEIKDGYNSKQGFSWKDLMADAGGIAISMLLRKVF